jgi:hypothetical protein
MHLSRVRRIHAARLVRAPQITLRSRGVLNGLLLETRLSNSKEDNMRSKSIAICTAVLAGFAAIVGAASVHAQQLNIQNLAIKSGETLDLGPVYFIQPGNCRSLMLATPEAEILEGPPGLTVAVKESEVVPRVANCVNKIKAGTLFLSAPQQIDDSGFARLVIRVSYKTKEGDRKTSQIYNLTLVP